MALSTGLAGALVLGSAGLASAYWRTTGSGSGSSKASAGMTLAATPVTVSGLYPGSSRPVSFTVTASGGTSAPFSVTEVLLGTVTVSGSGTCPASTVSFKLTSDLPAIGTTSVVLDGTVSMPPTADDGCQGSTFTIPLTVNGKQ